jgi:predicted Zn-dependent protease
MSSRSEQFQALVARQPDNELFRFSLAQALEAEGRDSEALPHYQVCLAKKADWMMPRILAGKVSLRLGRAAEGRALLEDALKLAVDQQHETPEAELRSLLASLPPL